MTPRDIMTQSGLRPQRAPNSARLGVAEDRPEGLWENRIDS
jgi:hypothetical protein